MDETFLWEFLENNFPIHIMNRKKNPVKCPDVLVLLIIQGLIKQSIFTKCNFSKITFIKLVEER